MREIKFRAWHTPFGDQAKQFNKMRHGRAGSLLNFAEGNPDEYKIMQYTGLKDKNGTEIYEGDIIEVADHPFQNNGDGVGIYIEGNYEVTWDDYDLTWLAGNLLLARIKPYIKVIGNIYENPELLGVEK